MRKIVLLLSLLCCLSAGAVRFPISAIRNCQLVDSANQTVTILFCPDSIPLCSDDSLRLMTFSDSIKAVSLYGPMTDYGYYKDGYFLDQRSEDGCYYHTFAYSEVEQPGNSGQPEFTFIIDMQDDSTSYIIWPDTVGHNAIDRRLMFYNGWTTVLLTLPGGLPYLTTDLDSLYQRSLIAQEMRPLADFRLSDPQEQHDIANFRSVPGTTGLYRSYHPFWPSMHVDSEQARLYWVEQLLEQTGIRSDICLTGDLTDRAGEYFYMTETDSFLVAIPSYYQSLIDSNRVCYVGGGSGLSVAECYYRTESQKVGEWFRDMVTFINDTTHPMPMLMHCAIGADRTGMFCALVESLCGQDWPTIVRDYMATGNMHVQTYRHPNRLRYGLIRLTGLDPAQCTAAQLATAIRSHLVDSLEVVSNEQLNRMVDRLNSPTPAAIVAPDAPEGETLYYDLMGRRVSPYYPGPVVQADRTCPARVVYRVGH